MSPGSRVVTRTVSPGPPAIARCHAAQLSPTPSNSTRVSPDLTRGPVLPGQSGCPISRPSHHAARIASPVARDTARSRLDCMVPPLTVRHYRPAILERPTPTLERRREVLGRYGGDVTNLRVALAQTNSTVGAIDANAEALFEQCRRAHDAGAHLVLTPELALTGYPMEDLALRQSFVARSAQVCAEFAGRLAEAGLGELVVALGHLDSTDAVHAPGRRTPAPQNKVAVLHRGRVVASYAKHHLPNYGVFDESRYFHPGNEFLVVTVRGVDVGFAICEDLWRHDGPVVAARETGVGLLAVLNASPYEAKKDDTRGELVGRRASEAGCALAYVNLVGGQDELVFDGDSMINSPSGELLA